MIRSVLVGFAFLSIVAAALADWPQWRGPSRDGVLVTPLPKDWLKQSPRQLWKAPLGEGYSSPVVADGRVYLLSREPGDKEVCHCFDAANGKELWRHAYDAPYKPADPTAGTGPKSTPTIDGDRVYMLGAAGMFHCFEARTGKILWKRNFATEYWGVEKDQDGDDAWSTCCGAASSPLIDGERLLLPVGGRKAGAVTALNKRDGQIVWKSLADRSSYASLLAVELAGRRQIVGFTGLRMVGVKADGGGLLWDHPFKAEYEQTIITPIVWKDLVIVAGESRPATALRIQAKGDACAKAVAWTNKDLRHYMCSPVAYRDHLYGLNEARGQLVCVELATGKTRWMAGTFDLYASIVAAEDSILVLCRDGSLKVAAADPDNFALKASWKLSEAGGVWASLAIAGTRLYLRDAKHLACYELAPK
ncbi:MAG: PQQ-like beta-propeller repeat protein [Planctomycetes bacterium]|nr:PQQ-like beta-propeller repeat protein [Planctomycetota bacterium]